MTGTRGASLPASMDDGRLLPRLLLRPTRCGGPPRKGTPRLGRHAFPARLAALGAAFLAADAAERTEGLQGGRVKLHLRTAHRRDFSMLKTPVLNREGPSRILIRALLAPGEARSEHPTTEGIANAAGQAAAVEDPGSAHEAQGLGLHAQINGKQVRRYKAEWTQDDAEAELAKALLDIEAAKPKGPGITLDQAVERYLAAKSRKRSVSEDRRILGHLKKYFGKDTPLADITASRISA